MESPGFTQRDDSRSETVDMLPEADFRVWRSKCDGWRVEIVTSRARRWARSNLNCDQHDSSDAVFSTDLAGVNSVIHRARLAGLVSEFSGPLSPVRI